MRSSGIRFPFRAPFGSFTYDPATDHYDFDERARAVLGEVAHDAVTYNEILERMPSSVRADYEMWRHETIRSGQPRAARIPFRVDNDREIVLEVHLHRRGGVVNGIIVDVTEDDERQAKRDEQLELMTLAERIAGVGSWRYDLKDDTFWGSPGATLLWGPDEATPGPDANAFRAALDAIHAEDRPGVEAALVQAHATGQSRRVEFRPAAEPDRWLATSAIRVLDGDGRPAALYGILMDVTAQHEREELRHHAMQMAEREELRSRFVSAAAHELSQPMTPLRLRLATLKRRGSQDAETIKSYELMERNLDRLQLMLQDLLDAARIQSGRLQLNPSDVDLIDTLRWTIDTLVPLAEERDVAVDWNAGAPIHLLLDATRLQQSLSNLIHNAIKYSPAGGHVVVAVAERPGQVRVSVTDTGIGLSQEQVARIFRPFEQVHPAPPGMGGSGLGLYITKAVADAFGGTVEVDSKPQHGSTFTLVLPHQGGASPEPSPQARAV